MNPTLKILALIGLLSAFAGACVWLGWALHRYFHGYPNPPATRRQIDRARRADLSTVRRPPGYPADFVPRPLDYFDHGGTEP